MSEKVVHTIFAINFSYTTHHNTNMINMKYIYSANLYETLLDNSRSKNIGSVLISASHPSFSKIAEGIS